MTDIAELGSRIELVSMDKHFHEITLGLYEQPSADGVPEYIVHSYAGYDGAADRIQFDMRDRMEKRNTPTDASHPPARHKPGCHQFRQGGSSRPFRHSGDRGTICSGRLLRR